jgi:hypothetical protein
MTFFVSFYWCKLEVSFVRSTYCCSCLFSGAISLLNLLAFHPKPFLSIKKVSCKQQIVTCSFLIQFAKHCPLMWELILWHSMLIFIGIWLLLSFSCFCWLRIWVCAAESMLLSYDLSFLLLQFNIYSPLMVLFAFIFCVQSSLQNLL